MYLKKITVHPGVQLVEYVRGSFTRVLGAGRHGRPFKATYLPVQTRAQITTMPVQEVPTADGLTMRVSTAVLWTVSDARKYVETAVQPIDHLYLAVQVALRDLVVGAEVSESAALVRREGPAVLVAAARTVADPLGIEVVDVVVKDVLVPPEIRSAQADLVTARTRGQAELEKARAESAALRSLANAAKLLDDHPALAQLRLVQALPYGSKLELSVGDGD